MPRNTSENEAQVGTLFGTGRLDLLSGSSGRVGMLSISPQKRHGKIVGYSVYLGSVGNERRVRRFFPQRRAAERFLAQQTTTPVPVGGSAGAYVSEQPSFRRPLHPGHRPSQPGILRIREVRDNRRDGELVSPIPDDIAEDGLILAQPRHFID